MKIESKKLPFQLPLLLLGVLVLFSFGFNTAAAADTLQVYVSPQGNNSWDGQIATWDGNMSGPKQTIANATGTVAETGTVYIAQGTYYESGINISTDMNIVGENQQNTIINGTQGGTSIFYIASGVNVTISNLTLTQGQSTSGGAIHNDGTLTIDSSALTGNTANSGGAIENYGTINLNNSTPTSNIAYTDESIYNKAALLAVIPGNSQQNVGGAIYNNGTLTVVNSTLNNNTAQDNGGAIYNNGTLTVDNSTLNNNTAQDNGGAINNFNGTINLNNNTLTNNTATYGGAIYNYDTLIVDNSTLTNNTAQYNGGAIYNYDGTLTIDNSTLTNNTAQYNGGAIYNYHGTLTIDNSTLTNNTAQYNGGAIENYDGTLTVNNSTLTNNTAQDNGGAIYNYDGTINLNNSTLNNNTATYGGAIYNWQLLTVNNSTFTDNNAQDCGGAIYNYDGTLIVTNNSFTGNTAQNNGGAIYNTHYNNAGNVNCIVNFNRIVGNSSNNSTIYSDSQSIDATLNWWGSNADPSSNVSGDVIVTPWLVLNVTSDPSSIPNGSTATVTANLLYDNQGQYHDPVNGHVPDGIPVTFNSNLGTLDPANSSTVNGAAETAYTTQSSGFSTVYATADNETASTLINVTPIIINVDPANGATEVPVNHVITVTFSDPIQAGAAYDKIKVITPDNKAKTITKTINGNTLTITATYNYTPGTYTLYIPKGSIQSLTGNNLTDNYNSTFTIATGPTVSNVDSSNILTTKTIVVTFNENISAGIAFNQIKVITSDNKAKIITTTINGNTLTIIATYNYTPGTYTLSIPANSLIDSNGNLNLESYTQTITT